MNHYTSFTDEQLFILLRTDPQRYYSIIESILSAKDEAVREMYEIDLYNGWF